jgi:hypothetical protein
VRSAFIVYLFLGREARRRGGCALRVSAGRRRPDVLHVRLLPLQRRVLQQEVDARRHGVLRMRRRDHLGGRGCTAVSWNSKQFEQFETIRNNSTQFDTIRNAPGSSVFCFGLKAGLEAPDSGGTIITCSEKVSLALGLEVRAGSGTKRTACESRPSEIRYPKTKKNKTLDRRPPRHPV